ncbi:MAG: ATP-binding cassette domain-containing protein, partial [Acidobacteria bacterium]|nr:ATP-binding cassette domain-containing protein [Acidobacteriota bacterium]
MLSVKQIEVSVGGSRILRGVNLEIPEKKVFCLMGRNGVGKTSTLKTIVGLLKAGAGSISLGGQDITR